MTGEAALRERGVTSPPSASPCCRPSVITRTPPRTMCCAKVMHADRFDLD